MNRAVESETILAMRAGTRAPVVLLCGALAMAWTGPAQANEPPRPPVQRPSAPVAETEPATTIEAEPEAPEQPAPIGPVIDGALPHYADIVSTQPHSWDDVAGPIPREVPKDGRGWLVFGSTAVLGGAAALAGTVVLAVDGVEPAIWGPTLLLGASATVAGGLLLRGGRRRLLAHREWEAARPDAVPRQGHGLVASGGVLLAGGAAAGMFGTIAWAASSFGYHDGEWRVPPILPSLVGVGVGSLAIGSVLMVVGMKRHKRFQAWRTRPQLVPGISPLPSGAQIGVSGRF